MKFQDGAMEKLSDNWLAVHMYSSVDEYVYTYSKFQEIVFHQKNNNAVPIPNNYVTDKSGQKHIRITAKG